MIPHFINHYRSLGIESFYITCHAEFEGDPGFQLCKKYVRECGLDAFHAHVGPWSLDLNQRLLRHAMDENPADWYVVADSDEFQVYDRPLPELVELCEADGYDYVGGCFLDRLGEGGRFPEVQSATPLWEQYPLAGSVSAGLLRALPLKVPLVRSGVDLMSGQHGVCEGRGLPRSESYVQVHHFKWTATVVRRLEERAERFQDEARRKTHGAIVRETNRFLSHVRRHRGVIDIEDPRLRIRPSGSDFHNYPLWTEVADEAQGWKWMLT
ncbi:glycosyltransferase family 2 protein [Streptomyces radiopugnans]|uniref:glycosyltransferase family 2 protein n=1 Tax=Streptomyces radiopugnans TaxID=403935 RepID=UPI003F1A2377